MSKLPKVKHLTFSEMWQLHKYYTNNQIMKSLSVIYPKHKYNNVVDANTFADLIIGLHTVNYESFVEFIKGFK